MSEENNADTGNGDSLIDDTAADNTENSQEAIDPNSETQTSQVIDEQAPDENTEDRPDFLLQKYENVEDQAKAYVDLQKKFGSFTGAPEKYEFKKDEKYEGIDVEADDPLLLQGMEVAKELGMNQEGFDKFSNIVLSMREQEMQSVETNKADQMKMLGDNSQQRVTNLNDFMKANMPEDVYQSAVLAANSADAVIAFEYMMSKNENVSQNTGNDHKASNSVSIEELRTLQFEKTDTGDRRMSVDPVFRKRVEQLSDQLYGTEPHRETVG